MLRNKILSLGRISKMLSLKKIALVLGTTALLLSQSVFALPEALTANYSVHKGSLYLGDMKLTLSYAGNQYHYYKDTQAKGFAALITKASIKENVDGIFNGNSLNPTKYYFKQSTRKSTRIENTRFSGVNAKGTYKDKGYDLKLPKGTLDRASLELALANDISNKKPVLSYNVMERGELKKYIFKRLGEEMLSTPSGSFTTTKVSVVRSGNKRSTTFWLAKELGYMPVKIIHKEKNDVISTVIKSYKTS